MLVCFIRHGETDWNLERRIQGQTDIPLNARGQEQARQLASTAGNLALDAIYSSDLQRALDTAHAIGQQLGLPVQPLPALRERSFGVLEGITNHEAASLFPVAYAHHQSRTPDYAFETGESLLAFADRIRHLLAELHQRHAGSRIALVAHAGILDNLYRFSRHKPLQEPRDFPLPHCTPVWFRHDHHGQVHEMDPC